MGISKDSATSRELIEIGSPNQFLPITAKLAITKIIRKDEYDIGFALISGKYRRWGTPQGTKAEEQDRKLQT